MKKTIPLPSEHLVLVKERKLFDLLHNHDIVEPLEASGVYFKGNPLPPEPGEKARR